MKTKIIDKNSLFFKEKVLRFCRSGFTIIELLLVIALIGILAGILIITATNQRERARATAFKEQMRTVVSGISSCMDANGTIQAPGDNADRRICSLGTHLGTYLSDTEMKDCDGTGNYTITTFADGVLGTCGLSGGDTCTALCSYNGCDFGADCD